MEPSLPAQAEREYLQILFLAARESAPYVDAASAGMSPGRGWIDWQPAGRLSRESGTRILINA